MGPPSESLPFAAPGAVRGAAVHSFAEREFGSETCLRRAPGRRRGKPLLRVNVYSGRSSVSCAGLGPAFAVSRLSPASRRSHGPLRRQVSGPITLIALAEECQTCVVERLAKAARSVRAEPRWSRPLPIARPGPWRKAMPGITRKPEKRGEARLPRRSRGNSLGLGIAPVAALRCAEDATTLTAARRQSTESEPRFRPAKHGVRSEWTEPLPGVAAVMFCFSTTLGV